MDEGGVWSWWWWWREKGRRRWIPSLTAFRLLRRRGGVGEEGEEGGRREEGEEAEEKVDIWCVCVCGSVFSLPSFYLFLFCSV